MFTQVRLNLKHIGAILFALVFLVGGLVVSTANAATVVEQVDHYTYYTNDNGTFAQSTAPVIMTNGAFGISQTANSDGSVTAGFSGVTGYADSGFYVQSGTLGNFKSVLLKATPDSDNFGVNIWFDKNNDSSFFSWNTDNTYAGVGGDLYSLGPTSSNGTLLVNDSSSFNMMSPGNGTYTVAQLKSGSVPGVDSNTKIALWIGASPTVGARNATIKTVEINGPVSPLYVDSSWGSSTAGTEVATDKIYGYNAFSTIQSAISAANPGDTINIASGTYEEQLNIGKNLTIIGDSKETTIIKSPATLNTDTVGKKNIVEINSGATVSISNIDVSGPGSSSCASIDYGVFVIGNATLNISDSKITKITDTPFGGCQNAVAIRVGSGPLSQVGTATINRVTISDYQKGGIVIDGLNSTGTITNNVITGAGTTAITAQNGIQISRGATATISGNTVTGNSYHKGDIWDWGATGILLYQSGAVTISDKNVLYNNDLNIDKTESGSLTLHNNSIGTSSAPVGFGVGIKNEDTDIIDATNNYWDTIIPTEIAAKVLGSVTVNPWFVNPGMTILSNAVTGSTITGTTSNIDLGGGTLPTGITNLTLSNTSSLKLGGLIGDSVTLNSGTPSAPIVLANSDLAGISASIPDGTVITGPSGWDGIITPPTTGTSSGSAPAGFRIGDTIISIGSLAGSLNFSQPVTILIPGVKGTVGYKLSGEDNWHQITNTCGGDYTSPTLDSGNECSIHNGTDTKILTKHFTLFGELNVVHNSSGSYIRPVVTPAIPAKVEVPEGCTPGAKFSTTTGKNCNAATPATVGKVLGAEKFNFTILIKNGSRGNEVMELQKLLTSLGYDVGIADGKFGPKTKAAVIKFQIANKLVGDGVVGAKTRAMLNK